MRGPAAGGGDPPAGATRRRRQAGDCVADMSHLAVWGSPDSPHRDPRLRTSPRGRGHCRNFEFETVEEKPCLHCASSLQTLLAPLKAQFAGVDTRLVPVRDAPMTHEREILGVSVVMGGPLQAALLQLAPCRPCSAAHCGAHTPYRTARRACANEQFRPAPSRGVLLREEASPRVSKPNACVCACGRLVVSNRR